MDLGIEGKTALVMGASKGIGRGIATALAREGARVAISGRNLETLEEAAAQIDVDARAFVADTSDLAQIDALPAEGEKALGPIEILITNTGGPPPGATLDFELGDWEAAYRSLVVAPLAMITAVVPGMRERNWGRIVNVGSTSTKEPIPYLALSNAHRMAAVGMFKTLATEVAGDGITVNTVATGMFATDRLADTSGSLDNAEAGARTAVPAGRLGLPDEYGDLVAFLASERAAYLTGAVIPLDGGMLKGA
jgi:3-oxoacyl-[acyl-carrier protein] reductase